MLFKEGVARTALPVCLLLLAACGSAPHDIVGNIPLGSNLADLDRYLVRGAGSAGEVVEWVPASLAADEARPFVSNEFGRFVEKNLGSYDAWKASATSRNRFTGQIEFSHRGSTSTDVNTLIYVNGKLRKKDWGFLPG